MYDIKHRLTFVYCDFRVALALALSSDVKMKILWLFWATGAQGELILTLRDDLILTKEIMKRSSGGSTKTLCYILCSEHV